MATCGGMCFIIDWRIALILLAMFAVTVIITKYVSLGSIIMAVFYPVFMYVFHRSVVITIISLVFSVICLDFPTNVPSISKNKNLLIYYSIISSINIGFSTFSSVLLP